MKLYPKHEGRNVLVAMLLLLGMFLHLASCGASANERAARTALIATNATRAGFYAYSDAKQDEIIEKATSVEQGEKALLAHQARQTKVVALLLAAYETIAVAFAADFDEKSMKALYDAGKRLKDAIEAMKQEEK